MNEQRPRRPTLDDLARAAGVSRTTASNAYNRPDELSADLRRAVLRTAKRIGYAGPNPVARSLARQRTGAIAFLLDANLSEAFSDPALSITLDAFTKVISPHEHSLVLVPGGAGGGPTAEQMLAVRADLAVAYSLPDDAPSCAAAKQRRLPLIAIDGPRLRGVPLAGTDDRAGARAAASHLRQLGHRRFGILTTRGVSDPGGRLDLTTALRSRYHVDRERLAGYLEGIADDGEVVGVWEAAGNLRGEAVSAAHGLLASQPRPTALLCMSDELALGAAYAARELDLTVPAELSLTGFDDVPNARYAEPALTTVRQDLTAKGHHAGELALRLLDGRRPTRNPPLATTLVIRASTAPPR